MATTCEKCGAQLGALERPRHYKNRVVCKDCYGPLVPTPPPPPVTQQRFCTECDHFLARNAHQCPHCGKVYPAKYNVLALLGIVVLVLVIIGMVANSLAHVG